MIRLYPVYLLILTVTMAPVGLKAQTSGLDFLTVGPNTMSLSINEATTATPVGASALYTNPANLVLEPYSSLSASHTIWIADLQNTHVAINLNNKKRAFAFGILASTSDDFEARTRPGPSEGTFSVTYFSLAGAYARRIGRFSIGLTGQYIREEFLVNDASGYAFNGGVSSEWLNKRIRAGIAFRNVGEMSKLLVESTELPASLHFGIRGQLFSITPPKNEDLPILVYLQGDFVKPIEKDIDDEFVTYDPGQSFVNIGLSLEIAETILLHGGFKSGDNERKTSFGAGLIFDPIQFDYALIPFSTGFGTVHSIGIQYFF